MRILAVDDNEVHCYALGKTLQQAGFEVVRAHTGHDALRAARSEKPQVVLLDIGLPDVNGFEVCSLLKSDPTTSNISIVFHTASHRNMASRQRAESLGAMAFLTYPVETDQLLMVVRSAAQQANRPESL